MRIPKITSIKTAVRIYYENIELYNAEIKELFGNISSATIVNLKNIAKEKMIANREQSWNARAVNTKCAYEAWGLEIADLEYRLKKLEGIK